MNNYMDWLHKRQVLDKTGLSIDYLNELCWRIQWLDLLKIDRSDATREEAVKILSARLPCYGERYRAKYPEDYVEIMGSAKLEYLINLNKAVGQFNTFTRKSRQSEVLIRIYKKHIENIIKGEQIIHSKTSKYRIMNI